MAKMKNDSGAGHLDDRLERLARGAFDSQGNLKPFDEQLFVYAMEEMPSGDMFIVAGSSHDAGIDEVDDLPIIMRQKTVEKIKYIHDLSLGELSRLPIWLKEHPLAMDSLTDEHSLVIIADAKDKVGNDIVIALQLQKESGSKGYLIDVNEIASVYGKENLQYMIENTIRAGLEVYPNERTAEWSLRTRLQLPEPVFNRLQVNYSTEKTPFQQGKRKFMTLADHAAAAKDISDGLDQNGPSDPGGRDAR